MDTHQTNRKRLLRRCSNKLRFYLLGGQSEGLADRQALRPRSGVLPHPARCSSFKRLDVHNGLLLSALGRRLRPGPRQLRRGWRRACQSADPPGSEAPIAPLFEADSVTMAVSREKDGNLRIVYAGWNNAKAVRPDEELELRARLAGAGSADFRCP